MADSSFYGFTGTTVSVQNTIQGSLDQAATAAAAADTSKDAAAASAAEALVSKNAAAASASSVTAGVTTSTTQATAAAASATAAAASAVSTADDAVSTAADVVQTGTDRVATTTSATAAASSATSAATAQTGAETALDDFTDLYLGSKDTSGGNPTVDNDGDALQTGALMYDSTNSLMKTYNGSSWVAAFASAGGALINTNNLSDVSSVSSARGNLGLGTAATTAASDYATAAQGALADTAIQSVPAQTFASLTGKPTTIAGYGITDAAAAGASVKYADGYAIAALNAVSIDYSGSTVIAGSDTNDWVDTWPTDSVAGAYTNGFSLTAATSVGSGSTAGSGLLIRNTSGASLNLGSLGGELQVDFAITNYVGFGTLRIYLTDSLANFGHYGGAQQNITANGNVTLTMSLSNSIANNTDMILTWSHNNTLDADVQVTAVRFNSSGSANTIATSTGYTGFATTASASTTLMGSFGTDSATASDYSWSPIIKPSAEVSASSGKYLKMADSGAGLEFITAPFASKEYFNFKYVNGVDAIASGNDSLAIGGDSEATATDTIAIGWDANSTAHAAVSIGSTADATGDKSIALGLSAQATHDRSVAIGQNSATTAVDQVMLGNSAVASVRVGNSSYTPSDNADLATKQYVDDNAGGSITTAALTQGDDGDHEETALIINFDGQTFNPRQHQTDTSRSFSNRYGWTGQCVTTHNGGGLWGIETGPAGTFPNTKRYHALKIRNLSADTINIASGAGRIEVDFEFESIGSAGNLYMQPALLNPNQVASTWTFTGISTSQVVNTSTSTGTLSLVKAGFQNAVSLTSDSFLTFVMGHWDGGGHTNYLDCEYRISQMRIYWGTGTTHTFTEPTRTFYQSPTVAQLQSSKYVGFGSGNAASGYRWISNS